MSTIAVSPRTVRTVRSVRPVRPAARSTVRLTRRGRVVVFVMGLAVVFLAGFVLAGGSTATEKSEPVTVVQVGPGETLWDIADAAAPAGRTAAMVEHIKDLNGLEGGSLQVGQQLRVPLG